MTADGTQAPGERHWHALSAEEAAGALGCGLGGLSAEEAAARLARIGPNRLPEARGPGLAVILLRQFMSPLIYLLVAAALVSLAIGHLSDAFFILVVLLVNAVIGAYQEFRSERGAAALQQLVAVRTEVLRDGRPVMLPAAELVPGDLVLLESGMAVPADLRLVEAQGLTIDESLLTGESETVEKSSGPRCAPEAPLAERFTLAHAGTQVASGRARALVVATGAATQVGTIAGALARSSAAPPLVQRLERFTRQLSLVSLVGMAGFGVLLLGRGVPWQEVFLVAVALAVAAIPEGLPVAVTVALSIGRARMAARNVIVRSLPAVEGLGACTLIASDKTGTLTQNSLSVALLVLPDGRRASVTGEGYRPHGALEPDGEADREAAEAAARALARAAAATCDASLHHDGEDWRHLGDTVDVAFLALAGKLGLDWQALQSPPGRFGVLPYEPQRRFAAVCDPDGEACRVAVKGAAETIFAMCAEVPEALQHEAERLAADGYRVIAVAEGGHALPERPGLPDDALSGLRLLGLAGLIDPLRPEVPEAVEACRSAGVQVRMLTGDHPATALAIARQLGIAGPDAEVVTGRQLAEAQADPQALRALVAEAPVFARVEPLQKLGLVEALQGEGHFVAVTGDGVNDAPALRQANIGVAMGRGGTDVARGAADLILTDDNFASIVAGVEEGRIAYANVRKVILFLIATGFGEIVLFALALAASLPIPLYAVQLLWLNLVTNGIQDVALAFERGDGEALKRRPRPPREPLFDGRLIRRTLLYGGTMGLFAFGFFALALDAGLPEAEARTALLLAMVLFENALCLVCRSERRPFFAVSFAANRLLVASIAGALALHLAATNLPGLSELLGAVPLSPALWLPALGLALALLAVAELGKWAWRATA
ncbi:ATPase, P-type (transporting), HAD superfamily, subfamily IC [Tistlia consotensis]|uniref:ATPase, P-type (Transporting), HAD superfamily, subfamily IC n=1 Tax=Tistlia consotensis USBA 355 TaxID=560819 RepID=A0A1Y6BF60_9PROT|nr:HAD-IC family P-type ATPase [Tistlia consotensis]SME98260.1 ATPase, P-type (transporting), HAD superfamily, subfamily IC [Tistlia consotensis USBA 355]SNR57574.1 ATPase, P-type (transporting), HAD superfamily, subfamily IC [Tistlia consotensis]